MAELTPTSVEVIIAGNKIEVLGTFTAASDADTWTPGLTVVEAAFVTNGANDTDVGATYSGGTITVQTTSALANAKILAIGV